MKTFLIHTLFTLAFLLLPSALSLAQTTWYVDDDNTAGPWDGSQAHPFQHIQDGIVAALGGDTVLVLPGNYVENIGFLGRAGCGSVLSPCALPRKILENPPFSCYKIPVYWRNN